ncbi:FAD binding domain protein [Aspergillus granulosus]|uniref:FAD binding domain protein n=1 Tax=Aspergillus granulosus TaxID=176169 RepID=A0ABR4GX08_9EURO
MSEKRPFRVIIVGAGIAGLTLSNALQRAGIENVVIEKHKRVVFPSGASIGIWPNGARLLTQLGCVEAIKKMSPPLTVAYNRIGDGSAIVTSSLFDEIVRRHGYEFLLLERQEFLRALYSGLPSQNVVRTGNGVASIEETTHGVRVTLADGSVEEGDMVVGCDGVASTVRQKMWENANRAVPGMISAAEMSCLKTRYKCLVGLSRGVPNFDPGSMTVVHYDGFSFLLFTHPDLIFWFVFIQLDQTYSYPHFPKYTQEDIASQAAALSGLQITEQVRFREIWDNRLRGELVNIEEGIFDHWHFGRTVLVGDAAHKVTPNVAFGGNSAMESAATLANLLHAKLASSPGGLNAHPSRDELSQLFQAYRNKRIAQIRRVFWFSTFITRVHACENAALGFIARACFPLFNDRVVGALFSAIIKYGVKLDYVPIGQLGGAVPFEDEVVRGKGPNLTGWYALLVVGVVLFGAWGVLA